jgi:exopolysaccharide biosynthesis WecB/TagA/CpsF family protein
MDDGHMAALRRCALVLNDGSGVALAALMNGRSFPENLNGSDFNPRVIGLAASKGWSVFFLGGKPGVAAEAARRLGWRYPDLKVAGTMHGFSSPGEAVRAVRESGADILMVAMGNPMQERFIDDNLAATGARIGIGVGAYFDFTAKRIRRAPAWTNRAGVEWVFRLALEPRRMWRRYVLGNPLFLLRAGRERLLSFKAGLTTPSA